jgi:hypothetical protein
VGALLIQQVTWRWQACPVGIQAAFHRMAALRSPGIPRNGDQVPSWRSHRAHKLHQSKELNEEPTLRNMMGTARCARGTQGAHLCSGCSQTYVPEMFYIKSHMDRGEDHMCVQLRSSMPHERRPCAHDVCWGD